MCDALFGQMFKGKVGNAVQAWSFVVLQRFDGGLNLDWDEEYRCDS